MLTPSKSDDLEDDVSCIVYALLIQLAQYLCPFLILLLTALELNLSATSQENLHRSKHHHGYGL